MSSIGTTFIVSISDLLLQNIKSQIFRASREILKPLLKTFAFVIGTISQHLPNLVYQVKY